MNPGDLQQILIGAVAGVGASTVFVLVLFIGFCVALGFTKTRASTSKSLVIRSLDERMQRTHAPVRYLPPSAPHGPADQLQSPELQEAAARKS